MKWFNSFWYRDDNSKHDPSYLLTRDPNILDKCFSYGLKLKSMLLIEYIIDGAETFYLYPWVYENQILNLVLNYKDPNNKNILQLLCTKEITLVNGSNYNIDDSPNESRADLNMSANFNRAPSTLLLKGTKGVRSKEPIQNILENSVMQTSAFRQKKSAIYMRQKRSPFNKFLEKSDIIEIAIREPQVSDNQEKELITLLYEHLDTPTSETVSLYKLLIYYEQVQTFELLLTYRISFNFAKNKNLKSLKEPDELTLGRKDDDNIYDFDEIISDAFAYSIRLNKLHIAFYLFNKYEEDVYGNKFQCIKSIFDSFRNDDDQVNHVMYLEERLFILEKFMTHIEYKMGLEFLSLIHLQITDNPKDNFLVYCANPLKIILILLNISIHISQKHQNLKFKAQKLRSSLCDIANAIIDASGNMNEVEDLLRDKTYSETEVINLIASLDIIEILQNPMIDSIISNMYFGPYEREFFLKKSTSFKVIDEQTNDAPGAESQVCRTFRIFGCNHSFRNFKKYFKSQTKLLNKWRKNNSK